MGANNPIAHQNSINNGAQKPIIQQPREFLGYQNPNQQQNISFHKSRNLKQLFF
jgi:hypothetical protein